MSANVESISSRELVLWRPPADAIPWIAPVLAVALALATYKVMPFLATGVNLNVPALSETSAIPQTRESDLKSPPIELAPPANSAMVNVPPQGVVAPPRPVTINVPSQDVVVVAVPPRDSIVINQIRPTDVARKLTVASLRSAARPVRIVRHAGAPHVRHRRVVVETDVEPVRHVVREPHLREVAASAPRPVPTPGLFPLPLKIFLADMFGGPRP